MVYNARFLQYIYNPKLIIYIQTLHGSYVIRDEHGIQGVFFGKGFGECDIGPKRSDLDQDNTLVNKMIAFVQDITLLYFPYVFY